MSKLLNKWYTEKVKILSCEYKECWYSDKLNEVFTVYRGSFSFDNVQMFLTFNGSNFKRIKESDCIVVIGSQKVRTHNDSDVEELF